MSRIVLFDPKLPPHVNVSNFQAEEFFLFSKLIRRLDEKRTASTPWLILFAKILSEHVFRIKTKTQNFSESYDKKFLNGNCEFGHDRVICKPILRTISVCFKGAGGSADLKIKLVNHLHYCL